MAAAPGEEWRLPDKRMAIIKMLEEVFAGIQPNSFQQSPQELERAVYEKAKSKNEYNRYLRQVLLRIRILVGQMPGAGSTGGMMPGGGMGMNPPAPGYNSQYQQYPGGVHPGSMSGGGDMGIGVGQTSQPPGYGHPGYRPAPPNQPFNPIRMGGPQIYRPLMMTQQYPGSTMEGAVRAPQLSVIRAQQLSGQTANTSVSIPHLITQTQRSVPYATATMDSIPQLPSDMSMTRQPLLAQRGSTPSMASSVSLSQAPPTSLPTTIPQAQSVYPGQQQQPSQQAHVQHPVTIWSGIMELVEMHENQRQIKQIHCSVITNKSDVIEAVRPNTWPQKMTMKAFPKPLFNAIMTGMDFNKSPSTLKTITFQFQEPPQNITMLRQLMVVGTTIKMFAIVHLVGANTSCPIKALVLAWNDKLKQFTGLVPLDQEKFVSVLTQIVHTRKQQQQLLQQQQQESDARNHDTQEQVLNQTGQASLHGKFIHLSKEKKKLEDRIKREGENPIITEKLEKLKRDLNHCHIEMKKSDKLFNEALAAGKVSTKITNVLIQGEAGVGKTSIKCLLLDQPPPEAHHSTPLAEAPVQIRVPTPNVPRCVSELRVLFSDNKWKALNERELEKLVTKVVSKLAEKISNKNKRETDIGINPVEMVESETTEEESQQTDTEEQIVNDSETDIDVNPPETTEEKSQQTNTEEQAADDSESILDEFQQVLINIHGEMVDQSLQTITDPSGSAHDPKTILGSNWIYFIDSGGQPHFHNLLPHFVHGISIAIFVHRLSRRLEEQSEVVYSEDGQPITPAYRSNLTTKDILKCLLRSIQSHTVEDQKPKLLFIGTFLDRIQESGETLEERNEKLLGLFTSGFVDQLLFYDDLLNELIFPVNTSKPGFHEEDVATGIRNMVETCAPSRTIDIPVWWYVLEITLKKLSSQLNRIVLSKQECLEIARLLNISDDALIESLKFFHHQHIFHYYPDILPEIMFTSPQLLLDKVTELVKEAYLTRNVASRIVHRKDSKCPKSGSSRKFRDQGILTLELLEQFDQHYITNLFSPCDLLKIFMHHLLITPLTSKEFYCVPNFTSRSMQYFMPSLLDMLSLAEVESHRIFSPDMHPLLIRFPNGWPRAGVFCCLQVYLIQQLGWKLVCHKQGKPKLIAQNCVMLSPPNSTCVVILIDSFSYLEIHVRAPLDLCSKKCPMIQEHIFKGIEASCRTLCYSEDQPSLASSAPAQITLDLPQTAVALPMVQSAMLLSCSWMRAPFAVVMTRVSPLGSTRST